MLQEERFVRIRMLLAAVSRLGTDRIAQELAVSRETVRRDIVELEALGALRRVHGGVVATGLAPEPPLAARQTVRAKEKRAIARAAVQLLQPGQTLFVDAGSTTALLAEELSALSGLTIITNGLAVALRLAAADKNRDARNQVILLGGSVNTEAQAAHGDITVADIHRYRADVALLSPVGVHDQHGATNFAHPDAAVARAMAQQAQRLVVLADHSKIGQASRVVYAGPQDIDTIVTDAAARAMPALSALQAAGNHVVVA
ncbi:DeoR/GlpR family DNA-binding transcription regulator [Ramlibacter sp. H39-3-26]|uniref:DeoR/GlpR family DNA-binding transcription regulator n=1 Tax=Curvibacter soli TaxID=3031331 RepID=UPI0023DA776D|nr:DeoR/GlpR family DNA-binding transcription regulator [Ramlibacter sp. H39-3-26]MDF1484535.1 DeoR/GlpR family DNA-binding transcription regulator [Ramlibacter sp. H39-3-26]